MITTALWTTSFLQMVLYGHLGSKSRTAQLPPDILVINSLCHTGCLMDCLLTRLHDY